MTNDNEIKFNGKTYKKIYNKLGTNPKEACINKCVFCELDDKGEPCCEASIEAF